MVAMVDQVPDNRLRLPVHNVAKQIQCRFSPEAIGRFCAATASVNNGRDSKDNYLAEEDAGGEGIFTGVFCWGSCADGVLISSGC